MTRPPCSESERAAAEQAVLRLGEDGYAVDLETFDTRASADPWRAVYAGLSALAATTMSSRPLVAVVVGIVAVVLHARDADGRALVRHASCSSVNVVARPPHASRPALVIVASLRHRAPRLSAETTRALVLSLQSLMVAIPAAGAAAWVYEAEADLPNALAVAGLTAASLVAVLALSLYRPPSEGAVTGPALEVVLDLAAAVRDRPAWIVLTGASEAGTAGIEALLAGNPGAVAGAAWLNLAPGEGPRAVAVSEEGTWRERRADRWLMGVAEEAGAEVRPYRAAPTNATPLLARRRRALTLLVPTGADGARVALATARAALDDPDVGLQGG